MLTNYQRAENAGYQAKGIIDRRYANPNRFAVFLGEEVVSNTFATLGEAQSEAYVFFFFAQ